MLGVLPQVRENIAFFGRRLKIGDSSSRPSRATAACNMYSYSGPVRRILSQYRITGCRLPCSIKLAGHEIKGQILLLTKISYVMLQHIQH